ncbi:MAG: FecR domain-containing protein [Pseudomonadales bacterium]|nr:FecR domain-containing protein [Pseudomonadales bacterium]
MPNIVSFPHKEQIREDASLWISRIDRGLTEAETTTLQAWVQKSDLHRTTLFEFAALWDDMGVLNQLAAIFALKAKPGKPQRQKKILGITGAAIAAALVLGLSLLQLLPNTADTAPIYSEINKAYDTVIGAHKIIKLPDGSSIHLNTNTQLKVSFSPNQRHIELIQGEAKFDVAHQPGRPFIVHAGENYFRAVGTIFNVQMATEQVELLVTEGKVLVSDNNAPNNTLLSIEDLNHPAAVLITSGHRTVIKHHANNNFGTVESVVSQQIQNDLAWQQGMIVFKGEPLRQALLEVSRYTNVEFSFADTVAAETKIAGYYKTNDIDELLASLTENFPLTYTASKGDNNRHITVQSSKIKSE